MSMYPHSTQTRPLDYSGEREYPLFKFFNQVYAWMCVGLALTGLIAFFGSQVPELRPFLASRAMMTIGFLGLFAISIATQSVAMRVSAMAGLGLFLLYAAVMGVLLSGIFIIYPMAVIGVAFGVTAGAFGGLSLFGFMTKRDLSGIGGFAIVAALGLFAASLINLLIGSSMISWFITYAVVLVFSVITAYKTQELKEMALAEAHNPALLQRVAVVGSLMLYISFINIFLSVLRIFGGRK